jgi:hypothetical protein
MLVETAEGADWQLTVSWVLEEIPAEREEVEEVVEDLKEDKEIPGWLDEEDAPPMDGIAVLDDCACFLCLRLLEDSSSSLDDFSSDGLLSGCVIVALLPKDVAGECREEIMSQNVANANVWAMWERFPRHAQALLTVAATST